MVILQIDIKHLVILTIIDSSKLLWVKISQKSHSIGEKCGIQPGHSIVKRLNYISRYPQFLDSKVFLRMLLLLELSMIDHNVCSIMHVTSRHLIKIVSLSLNAFLWNRKRSLKLYVFWISSNMFYQ